MTRGPFDYRNLSGRPVGAVVRLAAAVVPGVRAVQAQTVPYAEAWRRSNLRALGADGPLWVVLGDSLSLGLGASAFDHGWVGQVEHALAERGSPHRVINLAFSGATVADLLERQLPAIPEQPDLISVLVGSNDLLRKANRDMLPERYARLLDALPSGAVVGNLPNPRPAARAVNALQRADDHVIVADVIRSSGSWRGSLAADHFHPNDRGYAYLADAFLPALLTASARR